MNEEIICNTCRVVFKDNEEHRIHFKSQLHTFNLKRKVANLAPVTKEQFEKKMEQMKSQGENNKKYEGKCKECKKYFSSKNTYETHLISKAHIKNVEAKNKIKNEKKKNIEAEEKGNENVSDENKENENKQDNDKDSVSESTDFTEEKKKTPFPEIYTKILDINAIINTNMQTENGEDIPEEEKKEVEEKIRHAYNFGMEECIFL
eukprot:TRINITY_DN2335_c0_g1_i2.p2 TRINITY_DN2335_c0_g1~~TRINITY_DN2335_c0_g1_i2.p2  ORF type:complete len:205 (+),score=89.30 TRINITY_DN2335_c0_g1_i2:180-794(+)